MEKASSLQEYVKDNFIPEPKKIPKRIKKELTLEGVESFCPFCGRPLEYYYLSHPRPLITLKYDLLLRVVYKKCANEACVAYKSKRKFYNPSLDLYTLPKKMFALDVTLLIGHLIHQEQYTEEEVVKYLGQEHGIAISQPTVNVYKRIALSLGETLVIGNTTKIKACLDQLPVRVYSIDGLSSNKSMTLFVIREVISGIVLGAIILDAHDADTLHVFMETVFRQFGEPNYIVGDGERGLFSAIHKYYAHIPFQYCHRHFLTNLGKALMEPLYNELKKN